MSMFGGMTLTKSAVAASEQDDKEPQSSFSFISKPKSSSPLVPPSPDETPSAFRFLNKGKEGGDQGRRIYIAAN